MADSNTPNIGLLIADLGDVFNFGAHVENNFSTIDSLFGAVQCTSTTRPSNTFAGQIIYETDSKRYAQNTGSKASPVWTYMSHSAMTATSSSRPTSGLSTGLLILETDTSNISIRSSGAAWETVVHTGVWTTYTPAWTAPTTNPVLGNGSISGRWIKIGRMVHVQIGLTWGSTTTGGSGTWAFSLPVAALAGVGGQGWVGAAYALSAAAFNRTGVFVVNASATTGYPDGDNLNGWNATSPQTWAVNDSFSFNVSYEVAS